MDQPPQPVQTLTSPSQPSFPKYYFMLMGLGIIILLAILVFIFLHSNTQNQIITSPSPTPIPSLSSKDIIPAIAAVDKNIQETLAITQTNLNTINQLNVSQNASNSSTQIPTVLKKTIDQILNTNSRADILSRQLIPLMNSSSNSTTLLNSFMDINNHVVDNTTTLTRDNSVIIGLSYLPDKSKAITKLVEDITHAQINLENIQKDLAAIRIDFFATPPATTSATLCMTRPACLDAHPACKIAEPARGWCPTSTPTVTPQPTK